MSENDQYSSNKDKPSEVDSSIKILSLSEESELDGNEDLSSLSEAACENTQENLAETQTEVLADPKNDKEVPKEPLGSNEAKKKKKKGQYSSDQMINSIQEQIAKLESPDERIESIIQHMDDTLSQGGTPQFKVFWEIRKICLEIFKEKISSAVRAKMWSRYRELSKEARKLKEIFDEQSAFAVEQIDIAISALESDVSTLDEQLEKQPDLEFGHFPKTLEKDIDLYSQTQKKLGTLNAYASRITNLRKELIKTEMRVKQKNKFFQRLSKVGDKVFPMRKAMIKDLSEKFISDVEAFVQSKFSKKLFQDPVFFLREEIKFLQNIAKILTLNTHAFSSTRKLLSDCWEKLKEQEKEYKKEKAKTKEIFRVNEEKIENEINSAVAKYQSKETTPQQLFDEFDCILAEMKKVELGRIEVKALKNKIFSARQPAEEDLKHLSNERKKIEAAKILERQEKIDDFKSKVDVLLNQTKDAPLDELKSQKKEFEEQFLELKFISGKDKQAIKRALSKVDDAIDLKTEEALLTLSDDDKQVLKSLREVLKQRQKKRREVKEQVESLRKASGSSGFNIEKAMSQNQMLEEEKNRLDTIDQSIEEIEKKISELKKKVQ